MSATQLMIEKGGNEEHDHKGHDHYGSISVPDCADAEKTANLSELAAEASFGLGLHECFCIFVALLAVGVVAYSFVFENWTIVDSLYFTVVMLSSVGYGDISPTTPGGKIFTALFALAGTVFLGMVLGVVGSSLVEAQVTNSQRAQAESSIAMLGKDEDNIKRQSSILRRIEDSSFLSKISGEVPEFAAVLLGGLAVGMIEHWKWYDTFYYSVITATTIGFGDLAPTSDFSRAFAILYIPLAVGSMGYILGKVASSIVEKKMAEFNKNLWSYQLTMKDIDALDEDNEGGVDALEYTKFMLVAMKKIDGDLFDDLQFRFKQLDKTGDGKITKDDLIAMLKERNVQ